jgi:hypothetical protein
MAAVVVGSYFLSLPRYLAGLASNFLMQGLQQKFDLLVVVNLGDGLAHAAEFIAADEAGFQRVGGGSRNGEAGTEEETGEEGEGRFHGGVGLS